MLHSNFLTYDEIKYRRERALRYKFNSAKPFLIGLTVGTAFVVILTLIIGTY